MFCWNWVQNDKALVVRTDRYLETHKMYELQQKVFVEFRCFVWKI